MRSMNGVGESLRESAVFNFAGAVTMVIDDSPFALALTAQAILGFGIKVRHACASAADCPRRSTTPSGKPPSSTATKKRHRAPTTSGACRRAGP